MKVYIRFFIAIHFRYITPKDKHEILKGDITYDNFGIDYTTLNEILNNINIVINSSAVVKHYGDYNIFKLINIDGTKNIINFCRRFHKKLLHLSTLSVSGNMSIEENISNNNRAYSLNIYKIRRKWNSEKVDFGENGIWRKWISAKVEFVESGN